MSSLQEKVAIVTGASSGIGRATVRRFVEEGAAVVAIARRAERLAELRAEHDAIVAVPCDVANHAALEKCVSETIARFDRIDILVNVAGFACYEHHAESSLEHWRRMQAVNVEAMYVLAKLIAPHMAQRDYGRIVNVSSTQAIAAESGVSGYTATKGAINAWSRALAVDLAPFGILVNVVAPGCTQTEMSVIDGVDETTSDFFQEWYVRRRKIPLARPAQPDEVASAILFLSGDQCSYITGHTLVVDGGLTITF